MKLAKATLAVLACAFTANAGGLPAQIYVHPPLASSKPVSLTAGEANAVLSHRLGISGYESLPKGLTAGSKKGQIVFGDARGNIGEQQQGPKVVMVVYGSDGREVVPPALRPIPAMTVWSPPAPHSWDALISIYIGRVVHTLDVAVSAVFGLFDFVANRGHGDLAEWAGEWGGRVEEWVRWAGEGIQVSAPHERWSKILTEYGVADASSRQLMGELQTLDDFVERLNSGSPPPPLSTLRFSGLRDVENRYTRSSRQFRGAATLLATMLSAATNATLSAYPDSTIALLAIPVSSRKSIGRHTHSSLLAPFKTSERSFGASMQLERRGQVFGERQESSSPVPIISSSRKCYDSEDDCGDATGSCNGHGSCVQGRKTTGGSCYICQCSSTSDEDTGSTTYWSGETCEKKDVSSDFVLLVGSTVGLLVLFAASVATLYGVGSEELPQQLASVSGGHKKHD